MTSIDDRWTDAPSPSVKNEYELAGKSIICRATARNIAPVVRSLGRSNPEQCSYRGVFLFRIGMLPIVGAGRCHFEQTDSGSLHSGPPHQCHGMERRS